LSCDELSAVTGRWAADKGDLNSPCLKATLVSQAAEEPVVGSLHQAMLPTTVTAGPHLIVMLQTLPLSASECHHSGEGVAVGPTRRTPASQRGKREGPRVSAAVRRSPHIGVAAEETPAGTRSTHDEIPPTARWSTGAWPSSSPGLHSRGRSPSPWVVDRLGSRSSWQ